MQKVNICWLRRDLRLEDNHALYKALSGLLPVVILFIFDRSILDKLTNREDARVTFIHQQLSELNSRLQAYNTSLLVKHGTPSEVWEELTKSFPIEKVFANNDYEPYARERDNALFTFLAEKGIPFEGFRDQVIFEKKDILKVDGTPYTVFTPYFKQWTAKLEQVMSDSYPSEKLLNNLFPLGDLNLPALEELGFREAPRSFPTKDFGPALALYEEKRDYPSADATSHIGIHLRFGTISIRVAVRTALEAGAKKWLSELAWRDFYMMILWHFPHIASRSFKPAYDRIAWRNNEKEFKAWCEGRTGYPLVDAGMRQLNATGWMHNRVRMVVASFLTKHLLIDWRWGAAYFEEKLLDFELSSNVGGWQWASGSGNDAVPYFRIFNPESQAKKFDKDSRYIKRWVPEVVTAEYPASIVEHRFARERALKAYKDALF